MTILLVALFISAFGIVYPYLIYPLMLLFLCRVRFWRTTNKSESVFQAKMSFVISVYNGERYILEKLENIVNLNGFNANCQVIVVSDASTDRTDDIVLEFSHPSVSLMRTPRRVGKASAESYALAQAIGDIIIFTDASTRLHKDILAPLVSHFSDPKVGCVSTEDVIVTSYTTSGKCEEGLYVSYEMFLRGLESTMGILAGASGSAYACRRELAVEIPAHLTRDLHVPLLAKEKGFLTISEPKARCLILAQNNMRSEFRRKIRTFTGGIDTLLYMKHMLNPFRYGIFALALCSHKLVRWLGPVLMILMLVFTGLLAQTAGWAGILLLLQILAYSYCVIRYVTQWRIRSKIFDTLYFFVLTNAAAGLAWLNHFRGKMFITWEPTTR